MKILFQVSAPYLPQGRGGTEVNTHELCTALQQRGHAVAVLGGLNRRTWLGIRNRIRCFGRGSECCPPDEICGYPVFRARRGSSHFQRALDEVLVEFRPDVVITQLVDAPQLAQRAQAAGIPAAVYVHDVSLLASAGTEKDLADIGLLSNSTFTARYLREAFGLDSCVMYNLFRAEAYCAAPSGEYVTFVNPHPLKGVDLALSLAESCPHIPFLFVGSWLTVPEKKYLRRANAMSNITWTSSTSAMQDIYGRTRILIAPSCWDETWGRVVTEAQFSGIPVLASNRGGLPEAVGQGGMVLPEADLQAWRTSLEAIWGDIDRWNELSIRARQHAARLDIRPEAVVDAFLGFLEQVKGRYRRNDTEELYAVMDTKATFEAVAPCAVLTPKRP